MVTHDQASHHHGCLARTSPRRTRGKEPVEERQEREAGYGMEGRVRMKGRR